jgi:replicative DNA helicase
LSDLRESGSIEQDADVVMFIHREYLTKRHQEGEEVDEKSKRKAEIMLVKQRNGPPGDFELQFFQEYTRFENITRAPVLTAEEPYGGSSAPF